MPLVYLTYHPCESYKRREYIMTLCDCVLKKYANVET